MIREALDFLLTVVNLFYLSYAALISLAYLVLGGIALYALYRYLHKAHPNEYRHILSSPYAPGISLLAPAYNEGLTIIDNVKSLLSIVYNNLEIIIINDGSKDDTLQKLIEGFQLELVPFYYKPALATRQVRGVYKSRNRAFAKLLVVDKCNGGKADALNAGINLSSKELVACIDVDCIIEREALLKMVVPYLKGNKPVIATGGVVRIANSCVIEHGRLQRVQLPAQQIVRFQTLEYIRAFLLGRMAWSHLNGLLLISGAFGLFRKDIVLAVGGYNTATVGEDMELVVRMRAYMEERRLPYRVAFIPEPLCWTEAPASYAVLSRQRNRWTRGTIETLKFHHRLFFRSRYGFMGLVSYPFWLFFEWMAPLVEASGLVVMVAMWLWGKLSLPVVLTFLLAVYTFAVMISMVALVAEEFTYHPYQRKRDVMRLALTALVEPLLFHPRTVWWALLGNRDWVRGKKSWGEMTRQGFLGNTATKKVVTTGAL
jgi:hypothetical protein